MKNGKRNLLTGCIFLVTFAVWTALILIVDVQPIGQNGTDIGFALFNSWFHKLTDVHMTIYIITDWLGLVPIGVCMMFGGIGFVQLVKRGSLLQVDYDIIVLGIYYVLVLFAYLVFEMIPINFRPILIDGRMEVSYPSSTTLLVLCVMPTLIDQSGRRLQNMTAKRIINIFVTCFAAFMVIGRTISGVHWFTDIVGSILLSTGLFYIYKAIILMGYKEQI